MNVPAWHRWCVGALVGMIAGCVEPILLTSPGAPMADADGARDTTPVPLEDVGSPWEDESGPVLRIIEPADGTVVDGDRVRVVGRATDRTGVASVVVRAGPHLPVRATSRDGYLTFEAEVRLVPGEQTIALEGWDVAGREAADADRVRVVRRVAGTDERAPEVRWLLPEEGATPLHPRVELVGEATDDVGVVRMEARLNGEVIERGVRTDDGFATFTVEALLRPGEGNEVEVEAWDASGRSTTAVRTLVGRAAIDRDAPTLVVTSPEEGDVITDPWVAVTGSASDAFGVREVRARLLDANGAPVPGQGWVQGRTSDGWERFRVELETPPGAHRVQVRAVDANGLATTAVVGIRSAWVATWGRERTSFLRVRERGAPPELMLDLRRDRIGEVIAEPIQRQIVLLELDPTVLLRNTLDAIKSACGTRWREDNANPRHDCSLTPLGQTFRGPDGSWQTSAEYAMVRVLTMTPANVDVAGTSIEGLQELADGGFFGIRIGGGFSTILAESLGIRRTDEIVATDIAAVGLREAVLAPHPATTDEGFLPITLHDAMRDLAPLGERFGASGAHPGVVDPAVPPRGSVFTEETGLRLRARSNLVFVDGLSLREGKDYVALVAEPGLDVLDLDFTSVDDFEIYGLVDEPLADMRFLVREHPAFVPSCSGDDACLANLPGSPVGPNSYWAIDPWTVEAAFARTAWLQYGQRVFRKCYIEFLGCQADVRIGQDRDPPGWTRFNVLFNLGSPPRRQYLWELLVEIAQVRLHQAGSRIIPEGEANVAFEVRDIPVGLNASVVQDAIRPYLQDQAPLISDLLLGDYARSNGQVDFTLRADASGALWFFFADDDDPLPEAPRHARPGFFALDDLDEASRVSTAGAPAWPGVTQQIWRLPETETTVYAQDEEGRVWRLRVVPAPDGTEVVVHASPGGLR